MTGVIMRTLCALGVAIAIAAGAGLSGVAGQAGAAKDAGAAKGPASSLVSPVTSARAIETMRIEEGLRIELAASEPDIASPVALDINEDGHLFVVEMPGYPLDTSPSGRVRRLEDIDGDGRIDRSTTFADGLVLPTGVMAWKRGVLVTAAPDLLYFEDTNGDGRADSRTVVLTGFARTNPQHTVNSPIYGLDNWIYLAHEGPAEAIIFKDRFGDRGSAITFPAAFPARFPGTLPGTLRSTRPGPREAPRLEGVNRGIRLRPDRGELEAIAGGSQFGHAFDDWGHYFGVDNSNHGRHEVIAARYLARNPALLVERSMQDVSDHGNAAEIFPITKRPQFELLTEAGQFTSAAALTFYLGDLFPERFRHAAFVAEPVHNLVHRDTYAPAGVSFVARRALPRSEFLASSDPWFRPVYLFVAPDGSLLIVDYYRPFIEHPEWTSSEFHRDSPALYEGRDRGRLYRVVPEGPRSRAPWPRPGVLRAASATELVAHLAHPNAWWRRTAQRLLVDRQDAGAVAPLAQLVKARPSPQARVHALWTLDGLGALDADLVALALHDDEPGVRENAIRLAETRHAGSPALLAALLAMAGQGPRGAAADLAQRGGLAADAAAGDAAADGQRSRRADAARVGGIDPDARVRLQLLCTLGDRQPSLQSPEAQAARDRLLFANIDDPWTQIAAFSAASFDPDAYLSRALAGDAALVGGETPGRVAFFARLASLYAAPPRPAGPADARSDHQQGSEPQGQPQVPDEAAREAAGLPPGAERRGEPSRGPAGVPAGQSGGRPVDRSASRAAARPGDQAGPQSGVARVIATAADTSRADSVWWRAALLEGLARGLRATRAEASRVRPAEGTLLRLVESDDDRLRAGALTLLQIGGLTNNARTRLMVQRAAAAARSSAIRAQRRADAVRLLGLAGAAAHRLLLGRLVDASEPEVVQLAAVRALSTIDGAAVGPSLGPNLGPNLAPTVGPKVGRNVGGEARPEIGSDIASDIASEIGKFLLARWSMLTPSVRHAAGEAMLRDPVRTRQLVHAIADRTVPTWTLDFWQKRDLIMHDDEGIRRDARALLEERPEERRERLARYTAALDLAGDAARGRDVFARTCAACHTIGGSTVIAGGATTASGSQAVASLGPDLATVRHRPLSSLLADILFPSQSIAQHYETYTVEPVNGPPETGVLGAQTPLAITLKMAQSRTLTIPRRDVKKMTVFPQSAMPSDLDKVIDPQQMADLLTFIVSGQPIP